MEHKAWGVREEEERELSSLFFEGATKGKSSILLCEPKQEEALAFFLDGQPQHPLVLVQPDHNS